MGNLEFTIKNSDFETDSESGAKSASVKFEGYRAMILHPSFCCPVVAEKGKAVSIFLVTSEEFYKTYSSEIEGGEALHIDKEAKYNPGTKPQKPIAGGLCKRIINQALNITPWEELSELADFKNYNPKSIYKTNAEANDSMTVTYISELSSPNGVSNKENEIFANIRQSAFDRITGEMNLKHLFQIDLMNLDLEEGQLYDLSWITLNDEAFFEQDDKSKETPFDTTKFYEVQDKDTREFIVTPPNSELPHQDFIYAYQIEDDFAFNEDKNAPIQNHHPLWIAPAGKAKLNIGHLSDSHLSAREFVYKKCKAQIIPGADEETSPPICDLVNNNYSSFKDLLDQMGSDDEIDILILTGDLVDHNRNYNPKNMFFSGEDRKTGEIWEEFSLRHLDEKFDDGTQKYPSSIDNVLIYSLIRYFYSTYNKPVFLVAGNHEFYKLPYGISPRLKLGRAFWNLLSGFYRDGSTENVMNAANKTQAKENSKRAKRGEDDYSDGQKANDGIPADHNLTFYEATLMYGPDYNSLPAGATGKGNAFNNFVLDTVDWFFQIFSPLSDYFFKFKDQTFIGLEWGDNEQIIFWATDNQIDPKDTPIKVAGAVLPRACEAINDNQKALIETAINTSNNTCNVMFSHFTYTAFFPSIPHSGIGITNICGKHEFGTFHNNKDYIYLDLIKNNKLHYTLSGHTHRPGLYQLTEEENKFRNESEALKKYYKETGYNVDEKETLYVKPNEIEITTDNNVIYTDIDRNKTKMLVSSCAGPTGKFNAHNEFYGLGMDYPSGSYIKFSEDEEHIGMIRPKDENVHTAKPRFAVALEYADIVGSKNHKSEIGIFKEFILSEDGSHMFLELNPELKIPTEGDGLFKSIDLFFVKKNKTLVSSSFSQMLKDYGKICLTSSTENGMNNKYIQEILEQLDSEQNGLSFFISIKFNSLNHYKEFNHYNFDTPLVLRVSLESFKERIDQNIQNSLSPIDEFGIEHQSQKEDMRRKYSVDSGFFIFRDKKNGEVPNHSKLSKSGDSDYQGYNWKGKKGSNIDE